MRASGRRVARRIHRRFRDLPGAEHIASETAIAGLVSWLRRCRPKRVLEIGAGIGTLTAAILETFESELGCGEFRLVTIEPDTFCRRALEENVGETLAQATLLETHERLAVDDLFDFLVVDGGRQDDESVFDRLDTGAMVFIEGDRSRQAASFAHATEGRRLACADVRTLRRRTLPCGRRVYDGGYRIYRLEPSLGSKLCLAIIDLRTKLVYRLRGALV